MRFLALLIALLTISTDGFAGSQVKNDITKASLYTSHSTVVAGQSFDVGVLLEPKHDWHTYWENPGDAGIPTTFEWVLPDGVTASDIHWPTPAIIMEDDLAVFGYSGDVFLPVTITVPENFGGDSLPVRVKANWLVCHDICIPESAELDISVSIGETASTSFDAWRFEKAELILTEPQPLSFMVSDNTVVLDIPADMTPEEPAYFFPREENIFLYAEPQLLKDGKLTIPRKKDSDVPADIGGYLKLGNTTYKITAERSELYAEPAPAKPQKNLLALIILAMMGGLILNLMPCVLPVLSLKALAIAKKSSHERKYVVAQALAYSAGVVLSFALIAGLLISLQHAGQAIGWGYQMQSPTFVGALTVLLFVIGLNLMGMFELPVLFGTVILDNHEHRLRGSFLTGVLATAVATPCTAPFMATAVGATISQPPLAALLIFISIGVGLAMPFLLIALQPKLVRLLPKPGVWMETFKQFLSFPMFASVVWLLWVVTMQAGANGLLITLVTLLSITFLIWLKSRCHDVSPLCRIAILLLLAAALANGLFALSKQEAPMHQGNDSEMVFSESAIEELRAEGKSVFVDATAAWCLTCQVNKKIAIDTEATRKAFADTDTVLMIADWTNRNPEVTAFLKHFGYNGVPLYVYYPANGEPKVLPQILSESLVISTVKGESP